MTTARKFEDLKAASENSTLPNIAGIEKTARPLLTTNSEVDIEAKEDFAFVPQKETASKNAASDLRSAFENF